VIRLLVLSALLAAQSAGDLLGAQSSRPTYRSIAVDARLAGDAKLAVGDLVELRLAPEAQPETVRVAAITQRNNDPAEVARRDYRIRLHIDHLQELVRYGDRVDRFAVATRGEEATVRASKAINDAAFGFSAYRSKEISVETSKTFEVVRRFHRAIGVITTVASAVFLLCIMLLKVDQRRREVAAMRLMGISRASVIRSVMLEAALVALLGSGLGVGIGMAIARIVNIHYQGVYQTPLTFALVTPGTLVFSVVLSVVLGLAAGALAAIRLARSAPLALLGR
jgi:putative ABC transport system permease protein